MIISQFNLKSPNIDLTDFNEINQWVNTNITKVKYNPWQTPYETLKSHQGSDTDIAFLKYYFMHRNHDCYMVGLKGMKFINWILMYEDKYFVYETNDTFSIHFDLLDPVYIFNEHTMFQYKDYKFYPRPLDSISLFTKMDKRFKDQIVVWES